MSDDKKKPFKRKTFSKNTPKQSQPTKAAQGSNKERRTAKEVKQTGMAAIRAKLESGEPLVHLKRWVNRGYRGLPFNAATGKEYSGVNIPLLIIEADGRGHDDFRFLSLKQIKERGLTLKEGQFNQYYEVLFSDTFEKPLENEDGTPILDDEGKQKIARIPFLKYHMVYNACQIEGMPAYNPETFIHQDDGAFELIKEGIKKAGVSYYENGNKCFYSPSKDYISMVPRNQFAAHHGYEMTLLHEFVHATGHNSRLNRFPDNKIATPAQNKLNYAREEVTAEFAAVMLGANLGLEFNGAVSSDSHNHGDDLEGHMNYVVSWAKSVTDKELEAAITDSVKAVSYVGQLLGIQHTPLMKEAFTPKVGDDVVFTGPNKNRETGQFELRSECGRVVDIVKDKDGEPVSYLLEPVKIDFKDAHDDMTMMAFHQEDRMAELVHYIAKYVGNDFLSMFGQNDASDVYPGQMTLQQARDFWKTRDLGQVVDTLGFSVELTDFSQDMHDLAFNFHAMMETDAVKQPNDFVYDTPEYQRYLVTVAHHMSQLYGNQFISITEPYPDGLSLDEAVKWWSKRDVLSGLHSVGVDDDLFTQMSAKELAVYWGEKYDLNKQVASSQDFRTTPRFNAVCEWGRFDPLDAIEWHAVHEEEGYQVTAMARGLKVFLDTYHPEGTKPIQDYLTLTRNTVAKTHPDDVTLLNNVVLTVEPYSMTVTGMKSMNGQQDVRMAEMASMMFSSHPWKGFGDPDDDMYKARTIAGYARQYGQEKIGKLPPPGTSEDSVKWWAKQDVGMNEVLTRLGINPSDIDQARTQRRTPYEFVSEIGSRQGLTPVNRQVKPKPAPANNDVAPTPPKKTFTPKPKVATTPPNDTTPTP